MKKFSQYVRVLNAIFSYLKHKSAYGVLLCAMLAMPLVSVVAAPVLATKPLNTRDGSGAMPNLMFVMDTSDSMLDITNNAAMGGLSGGNFISKPDQCKVAWKNHQGVLKYVKHATVIAGTPKRLRVQLAEYANLVELTDLTNPNDYTNIGNIVQLSFPNKTEFSGVYKVIEEHTDKRCTGSPQVITDGYGPYCYNEGPASDPYRGCKCNYAGIVDTPNSTEPIDYYGTGYYRVKPPPGGGVYAANEYTEANNACWVVDPVNPTRCPGVVDDNYVEVVIEGDIGDLSDEEIQDAALAARFSDQCVEEPPQKSAKIDSLFYNPDIRYTPPPSPKKIGEGKKAPIASQLTNLNASESLHNLLKNMDYATTSGWTKVPINGLNFDAFGEQVMPTASNQLANLKNGNKEMVYCRTPNRPSSKLTNDAWLKDGNECKHNVTNADAQVSGAPTANKNSPNYPYVYPQLKSGVSGTSLTRLTRGINSPETHQNGQSIESYKRAIYDFSGGDYFAFGVIKSDVVPYYYEVTPVEYCSNHQLTDCKRVADGTYNIPAYVRYCYVDTYPPVIASHDLTTDPPAGKCGSFYEGTGTYINRFPRYGLFEKFEIKDTIDAYPPNRNKSQARTDCAGETKCTYAEEMTNYANWFAYYRNRLNLMKSAAGLTFDNLNANNETDAKHRVGFMTVEGYALAGHYLPIQEFTSGSDTSFKKQWFQTLYNQQPTTGYLGTNLLDALSTVGRIYAGKHPIAEHTNDDPVQYACQKNFTLLTTDGYWTSDAEQAKKVDGSNIGNQDSDSFSVNYPQREGEPAAPNTLADVAQYYYKTDLRNEAAFGNCSGAVENEDVCEDAVQEISGEDVGARHQRMVTFTVGLGVKGRFNYVKDYKTQTSPSSGDYYDITKGVKKWPSPRASGSKVQDKVDDLWHAAVNGRGTYFNAQDPQELIAGLKGVLTSIDDKVGTAAATETSSYTPVDGDNYAFSTRFTTGFWTGNVIRRSVDDHANLGDIDYCAETVGSCNNGSLATKIANNTRKVYFAKKTNGNLTLEEFKYSKLTSDVKDYFDVDEIENEIHQWGQWSRLSSDQKDKVTGTTLVDYLRGQRNYEQIYTNPVNQQIYRARAGVLGDFVDSDPAYVKKPNSGYSYSSYTEFVGNQSGREARVYVGGNDGMLHAFDAELNEQWAFVPKTVMPNMYKLADEDYRTKHTNYVNGEITIADVEDGGNWKTILIAGLGQGGKGFFALDITDPAAPIPLWEINNNTDDFDDLGYSYGKPQIVKSMAYDNGKWVALLTSGYNNHTNDGDGEGHLYVVDALTGDLVHDIATGEGSGTDPSGLGQVSPYLDNPPVPESQFAYGGDLKGNVFRFNIHTRVSEKITTLKSGDNNAQPITSPILISQIEGKPVLLIGTGKLLEVDDLKSTNYAQQSIYALQDNAGLLEDLNGANVRSNMQKQTFTASTTDTSGKTKRGSTGAKPNWETELGWYIDLDKQLGERQTIEGLIAGGLLIMPTNMPQKSTCDVDGSSWYNTFSIETGAVQKSIFHDSPIVGVFVTFPAGAELSEGSLSGVTEIYTNVDNADTTDGDGGTDNPVPLSGAYQGKRAIWRELIE